MTFIVMEKVSGDSLRALVEKPLPIDRVLDIGAGIAAGLSRAHRAGVVHRDLKPDNVVLTDEGQPKILDFGLGKIVQEARTVDLAALSQMAAVAPDPSPGESKAEATTLASDSEPLASPQLTRAGQVVGTLLYMSPEQVEAKPVDARTDVFSFGVLLYEMLAGQRPFEGDSALGSMTSILRDDPPPLKTVREDVPAELVAIMHRCLEKNPDARYQSGKALHEALEDVKARMSAPRFGLGVLLRRPAVLVSAVVAALLIVAAGVWFALHTARVRWARNEALPEIERLAEVGDRDAALRLAREAARYISSDPVLEQLQRDLTFPVVIETDPPGGEIFITSYEHPDRPWIRLGIAPLELAVPFCLNRFRIEKPAYETFEGTGTVGAHIRFVLVPEGRRLFPALTVEGWPA